MLPRGLIPPRGLYCMVQNETKICPSCGRIIRDLKDLEIELGKPVLYIFQEYERWRKLKEEEISHTLTHVPGGNKNGKN